MRHKLLSCVYISCGRNNFKQGSTFVYTKFYILDWASTTLEEISLETIDRNIEIEPAVLILQYRWFYFLTLSHLSELPFVLRSGSRLITTTVRDVSISLLSPVLFPLSNRSITIYTIRRHRRGPAYFL